MSFSDKLKTKISSIEKDLPIEPGSKPDPTYEITQSSIEPIYQFDLSEDIDATTIVNCIYNFKEKYPISNTSNIHAWHSDYDTHRRTKDFDNLIEIIKNKLNLVRGNRGVLNKDFIILDSWVAIYNKDDRTAWHDHGFIKWVAVYYARAEENCSPIVFNNLKIKPKTNMLLLFPGRVRHMVERSSSDIERIIFSAGIEESYSERKD